MLLYHGSDTEIDSPRILRANRPLDFGEGFYTTVNIEQAWKWATRIAVRNNTKNKTVNCYNFDMENAKNDLRIIEFIKPDEKWLDFICENRKGNKTFDYDIVIGPVADDTVFKVIINYEMGIYEKQEAIKRLKVVEVYNQILFHTDKSLSYLKYLYVAKEEL